MLQMNCINFCELLFDCNKTDEQWDEVIKQSMELAHYEQCERIYVGSYFCANYFLHLKEELIQSLDQVCQKKHMKLTLVVPTFTQKDIVMGKKKIKKLSQFFSSQMDEVTVNDYGMLKFIHDQYKVSLNIGRLLMKDYRDLRYSEYFHQIWKPKIFTPYFDEILKQYEVSELEFDPTHEGLNFEKAPSDIEIGLHTPYCYMTVGHICEYGSIHKDIEHKFRPNDSCQLECKETMVHYHFHDEHNWIRYGRAVYFSNPDCKIHGVNRIRTIYFPVDLGVIQ